MGLLVWLPLNGNLNNQGINSCTITNSSATVVSSGKIGSCYKGAISLTNLSTDLNVNNISISFWVKTDSSSTWQNIISLRNSSGSQLHGIYIADNTRVKYEYNPSLNLYATNTSWHHYTFIIINGASLGYLDGVLCTTSTESVTSDIISQFVIGSSNVYLNDVRIYDHCLSTKEVEELAKGLILHYKLNDGYIEPTTNVDPLGNTTPNFTNMTSCTYGNYFGRNCYKVICSASSTGWVGSYSSFLPTNSGFAVGDVLTRSCDLYIPSGLTTTGWYGVPYAFETCDNVTKQCYDTSKYNTWLHCWSTATIRSTSSNFLYYWFATSNATCTIEFYITNMQCENKDHSTPFTPSSRDVGTCYDSSGYGYNGTVVDGSIPSLSLDAPRYDKSYNMLGTKYIKNTSIYKSMSECSICFWIKPSSSSGGYQIVMSQYNNPSGGLWIAVNCEGASVWAYHGAYMLVSGSLTNGTWYHCVFTFNNGTPNWYINGVKQTLSRSTYTGTSVNIYYPTIGNSYTGSSWNTTQYGNLSDFRIYATALSDSAVKELYNSSASIDNQGNIHVRELIEN